MTIIRKILNDLFVAAVIVSAMISIINMVESIRKANKQIDELRLTTLQPILPPTLPREDQ